MAGHSKPDNSALDRQIAEEKATKEEKRVALMRERMSLIKSQGSPQWYSDRIKPID